MKIKMSKCTIFRQANFLRVKIKNRLRLVSIYKRKVLQGKCNTIKS